MHRVHHHPCQDCHVKLECGGDWEENYDGWPNPRCREFHQNDGGINTDFLCDACEAKREAEWQKEQAEA